MVESEKDEEVRYIKDEEDDDKEGDRWMLFGLDE